MARPFFSVPIDRLEALARDPETAPKVIGQVRNELDHRSTFRAAKLRQQLDERLKSTQSDPAVRDKGPLGNGPFGDGPAIQIPTEAVPPISDASVSDLKLLPISVIQPSVRATAVIARLGITTVGDLMDTPDAILLRERNCGRKTLRELRAKSLQISRGREREPVDPLPVNPQDSAPADKDALNVRLLSLDLSARAKSFLAGQNISYAGQLCHVTEAEALSIANVGRTTVRELRQLLNRLGLKFGTDVGDWTHESAKAASRRALPLALQPPEPDQLEVALRARVGSVTRSERNLRWTVEHLGWDGRPRRTLEAIGRRENVSRERVRQVVAKACRALKERGSVPLALRHTIALIRANLPLTQATLDDLLQSRGLAKDSFHVTGIKTAAETFGLRFPFIIADRDSDPLILPASLIEFSSRFIKSARRAAATFGCVVDDQLLQLAEELAGKAVNLKLLHSMLEREGTFTRLQAAPEWWWRPPQAARGRNRLVNTIVKVLAACPSINVRELRDAVRRPHRSKHVAPPSAVLASLCASLRVCRVRGDVVERVENELDWHEILNPSERLLVEIFERLGPVAHTYQVSELGLELGINETSLSIYKTYSPLIWRPAQGYYSLIGSTIPLGLIEELQASAPRGSKSFIESGWTSDARLFLCYKINKGVWHSGLVTVPSSVQSILQGGFKLTAFGNQTLGQIEIREATIFSFRKLFRMFGAEEGDVLLAVFDIRGGHCEAWLGGFEMARLMREGKADDVLKSLHQPGDNDSDGEAEDA